MTTLNTETYGNPEIVTSDSRPNFTSGFFSARNPFDRVEFDDWAEGLDEMIELFS